LCIKTKSHNVLRPLEFKKILKTKYKNNFMF
jgi:hypothetical protein